MQFVGTAQGWPGRLEWESFLALCTSNTAGSLTPTISRLVRDPNLPNYQQPEPLHFRFVVTLP